MSAGRSVRKATATLVGVILAIVCMHPQAKADSVNLITLAPGHFHAGLVQKFMYPEVSPVVHVYAPAGPDLQEHLNRIDAFNSRSNEPTHWREKVYAGPDFLDRMLREKPGNLVVISGNNAHKTEYLSRSVEAGLNVLADKPMAINPRDFKELRKAFAEAAKHKVLLYDIMTERFEVTIMVQKALSEMPEVFGALQRGTPENPSVVMESVHHFFKEVVGKPLIRPAWFYDVRQEGEAIPDVGTHLVDLVLWQSFPDQPLDWRKDVAVREATRWPVKLSREQFERTTGERSFPGYLQDDVDADGKLNVFQNGSVLFRVKNVWAKVTALWRYEAPPGAKDSHEALFRGTRAELQIRQGPEQGYNPALYVDLIKEPGEPEQYDSVLKAAIDKLTQRWPGLGLKRQSARRWQVVIPDKYSVGHEAHFAQVTENYLKFLARGKLPDWEVPNMLAKYRITTEAFRAGHRGN